MQTATQELRTLAQALRTLHPDFDWDYNDDCKCALAVAEEIGLALPLGLNAYEVDYIFFNPNVQAFEEVSPTRVAAWIDVVLLGHEDTKAA